MAIWMDHCHGCKESAPTRDLTVKVWDEARGVEYRFHPEHESCLGVAKALAEGLGQEGAC